MIDGIAVASWQIIGDVSNTLGVEYLYTCVIPAKGNATISDPL